MMMKKLFLTSIAALFLATGTATLHTPAKAQSAQLVPGSPEWKYYNCARAFYQRQIAARDPRWQRQAARRLAGVPVETAVHHTKDGQSITQSAVRHCGAKVR